MQAFHQTRSRTFSAGQPNYKIASGSLPLPSEHIPLGPITRTINGNIDDFLGVEQLRSRIKDEYPQFLKRGDDRVKLKIIPDEPTLHPYMLKYPRIPKGPKKTSDQASIDRLHASSSAPTPVIPTFGFRNPRPADTQETELPHQEVPQRPIRTRSSKPASAKVDSSEPAQGGSDTDQDMPDLEDRDGNIQPRTHHRASPVAIVLSSDDSSDIDHEAIQDNSDNDRYDSDVERTTIELLPLSSEKANRGFFQVHNMWSQSSVLLLRINDVNQAAAKYIFDSIIQPAVSPEINLEVQHCRATLNVRRAFDIIRSKVVIVNKLPYLSRLGLMLQDTRILPGETVDMLTKRIDLIHKATAKLTEAATPPDSEFILHMIRITGLSSPEFDTISYKINKNTGIAYDRTTVIAMFTQHLQHITRPSAPLPTYYFRHVSTFGTSFGNNPSGTGAPYAPRSISPAPLRYQSPAFVPRQPKPFPSSGSPFNSRNVPPQHLSAITATPQVRQRPFTTPANPSKQARHHPISNSSSTYATFDPAGHQLPNEKRPAIFRCSTGLELGGCGNIHKHFEVCPTSKFIHQSDNRHEHHETWMKKHYPRGRFQPSVTFASSSKV